MAPPRREVAEFVQRVHPGAGVEPIAGDASTRRFFRLRLADRTVVLMDYGSPFEEQTDDVRLHRVFRDAGLPVAEILAVAPEPGCLVLEDLGDRSLESALAGATEAEDRFDLLVRAGDLARTVAVRGTPVLAGSDRSRGPALDEPRFRFEMDFFLEHFAAGRFGAGGPPSGLRAALHALAAVAAETPAPVMCHRDFHSRNLLLRADGSLAMVDIQDARWGPDSYDLASLVRDAYVEIDDSWVDRLVAAYLDGHPSPPPAEPFRRRFDIVSAQRMIKALGTFGYQSSILGRDRYLEGVPRTLRRLRDLLPRHPETAPLHSLLPF